MARGRFVSKEICIDRKVNQLSSPWSMLAFTWLLTHADREGRTYGDPSVVKSMVFPRQDGMITTDQIEGFINEWQAAGLIVWYEVDGDKFIEFPNFEKHQVGLRKEKEPVSTIPPNIRQNGVKSTAEDKLREVNVKLREVEGEEEPVTYFPYPPVDMKFTDPDLLILDHCYMDVTGFLPPKEVDRVRETIRAIAVKNALEVVPKNKQAIVSILRPFYKEMCKRKNKHGKPYSKSSLFWLFEWAAAGEIPPVWTDSPPETIQRQDPALTAKIRERLKKETK